MCVRSRDRRGERGKCSLITRIWCIFFGGRLLGLGMSYLLHIYQAHTTCPEPISYLSSLAPAEGDEDTFAVPLHGGTLYAMRGERRGSLPSTH